MKWFISIILIFIPFTSLGETISYEIYELSSNRNRNLLAKGIKKYSIEDVVVQELRHDYLWSKTLHLDKGFSIGASVYRKRRLNGFGMWIISKPRQFEIFNNGGFSWEWFVWRTQDIYRKLQGSGQVKVTTTIAPGYEELSEVEFLNDVTMRLGLHPWMIWSKSVTHHIVIRKGSIFKLSP